MANRKKTRKTKEIRARVTKEFKERWLDFVQTHGGDEDESTMLREAIRRYMQEHPPGRARITEDAPDHHETVREQQNIHHNRRKS